MRLREARCLFTSLQPRLIEYVLSQGYEICGNEWVRTPEMARLYVERGKGTLNSLHLLGLAIDYNLYKNGKYLEDSEDHRFAGTFWKSLHPLCRWGGDFVDSLGRPKPDGNHYSIEWEGRK